MLGFDFVDAPSKLPDLASALVKNSGLASPGFNFAALLNVSLFLLTLISFILCLLLCCSFLFLLYLIYFYSTVFLIFYCVCTIYGV